MQDFGLDLDWPLIVQNALHVLVAFILVLPMGWDRERAERLGLRTIPLVSVAACGYALIGIQVSEGSPDSLARFFAGMIGGVGFLGGGAILKQGTNVMGTATAATIWNTAAIGGAVAVARYEIAILLAGINLAILVVLGKVGEKLDEQDEDDAPPPT